MNTIGAAVGLIMGGLVLVFLVGPWITKRMGLRRNGGERR